MKLFLKKILTISLSFVLLSVGILIFTVQAREGYNGWGEPYPGDINFDYYGNTSHKEVLVEGDYEYTVANEKAIITKYIGEGGDVIIPSTLGGLPVRVISYEAFISNSSVISVVIPEGVKELAAQSFFDCRSLTNVVIPNSITTIGPGAFYLCESLQKVVIPNEVKTIEDSTFARCHSLTEVILPQSLTCIEMRAFSGCRNLKEITIPSTVTDIRASAFSLYPMLDTEYLDIIIYAESDTQAQRYAEKNGISFVAITEYTTETLGDINGDESINAQDALLALQHSVRLIDLRGDSLVMADMNQSNLVDAQDALLILQKSVNL